MTSPNDGRLSIEVAADTGGLRAKLRAAVDQAASGLKAKVEFNLQTSGLKTRLRGAVDQAASGVKAKIDIELQTSGLRTRLREAVKAASEGADAKVGVDLDTKGLRSRLIVALKEASEGISIDVPIHINTAGLRAKVTAATKAAGLGENVDVGTDTHGDGGAGRLGSALSGASGSAFGLKGALIGLAVTMAGPIIAAVTGLAALIGGPLVGAMLTVPFAALSMGAAFGALFASIHGILGAFKALSAAQTQAADSGAADAAQARATANARISAAQGVASAQQQLTDAVSNAAYSQRQALGNVETAEDQLANAQYSARQAQQNLTQARQDATRALQDMRFQVAQGRIDEQQATIAVHRATLDLENARNNGATGDTLEGFILALQEAQLTLARTHTDNLRNTADLAVANRKGVEGSNQVVSAQHEVQATLEAVHNATLGLAKAQEDLGRQQHQNAEAIAAAQQNLANSQRALADAYQAQTSAGKTAADKVADALDKLSPSAQKFVLTVYGWKTAIEAAGKSVQERFFAPILTALPRIPSLLGPVASAFGGLASAFGNATRDGINWLTSPAFLSPFEAVSKFTSSNLIPRFAADTITLGTAFGKLSVASIPFASYIQSLIDRFSGWTQKIIDTTSANGSLGRAFKRWEGYFDTVLRLTGALGLALFELGGAAAPAMQQVIDHLSLVINKFNEWAKTPKGKKELQEVADLAKRVLTGLIDLFAWLFIQAFNFAAWLDRTLPKIQAWLNEHPRLKKFAEQFGAVALATGAIFFFLNKIPGISGLGNILGSLVGLAVKNPELALVAVAVAGIAAGLVAINNAHPDWLPRIIAAAKGQPIPTPTLHGTPAQRAHAFAGGDAPTPPPAGGPEQLGAVLKQAGDDITEAWHGAYTAVKQLVSFHFKIPGTAIDFNPLKASVKFALTNMRNIVVGGLDAIAGFFSFWGDLLSGRWGRLWGDLRKTAGGAMNVMTFGLSGQMTHLVGWLSSIIWGWAKGGWQAVWGFIQGTAYGWLVTIGDGLVKGATAWVDGVGRKWDELKARFKDPINWVIRYVLNDGILAAINTVVNGLGGSIHLHVNEIGGGAPAAPPRSSNPPGARDPRSHPGPAGQFAVGGAVPGPDTGQDRYHIRVRGEEHILTPEEVNAAGDGSISRGHARLIALRSALMGGRPVGVAGNRGGFSIGGGFHFPSPGDVIKGAAGVLIPGLNLGGADDLIKSILEKGGVFAINHVAKPLLDRLVGLFGKNWVTDIGKAGVDKILSTAAGYLDHQAAASSAGGDYTGPLGGAIGAIIDVMRRSGIPGWLVNSSLRPGDPGYHGSGNAVDFGYPGNAPSGLTTIARYWDRYRGSLLEEIYSGDGGHFAKFGKTVSAGYYGAETVSQHFNHVHIAATLAAMQRILSGAGTSVAGAGGILLQALGITHEPASWLSALQVLLGKESSGGKDLTNFSYTGPDGSHPSGPFQMLMATFLGHALPGHGNIHNLLDSAISAIRYIAGRWGNPGNIPGLLGGGQYQGYYDGGTIDGSRHGTLIRVAERGRKETITDTRSLNDGFDRLEALLKNAGQVFNVYPAAGMDTRELALMVGREQAWASR